MRIDLEHGTRRPLPLRLGLWLIRRIVGLVPGPVLALTYQPQLMHPSLRRYIVRGVGAGSTWSRGEAELFSAFISDLNRCHF